MFLPSCWNGFIGINLDATVDSLFLGGYRPAPLRCRIRNRLRSFGAIKLLVFLIRKADGHVGPGFPARKITPRPSESLSRHSTVADKTCLTQRFIERASELQNMPDIVRFTIVAIVFYGSGIEAMRLLSGWKKLEPYAASRNAPNGGQISNGSYRWVSCRSQWTRFAVAVELYPQHLWLRPSFPLNLRLPAICIPWDSINASQQKIIFSRTVTLRIQGCPTVLRFCGAVGQRILAEVEMQRARRVAPDSVDRADWRTGL
ncbi:MAG: hypothetical protein V4796_09245 [Burkholderia cenocepacia]